MILRLLLVGVVSGLGIQPPPADALRAWANEGRDWWVSRVAEWNDAFVPIREVAEVEEEDVPSADDFLADSPSELSIEAGTGAPVEVAETVAVADPAEAVEMAEAVEPAQPDIDALFAEVQEEMVAGFLADPLVGQPADPLVGQPAVELVANSTTTPADSVGVAEDECGTNPIVEAAEPAPTPVDGPAPNLRLARALKLTGDALHAWAALLQGDRDKPSYQ